MIVAREDIARLSEILQKGGRRVVFTNGCFDILHAGHVRYLQAARALGDCLILGLNTDASVRALKGEGRPIHAEGDRAEVLDALAAVDYIVLFDEPTAERILSLVRPQIYAKGGDYTLEALPEREIVREIGAEVAFLSMVEGRSTTNTIAKIRAAERRP